jgi:hypothetical protein
LEINILRSSNDGAPPSSHTTEEFEEVVRRNDDLAGPPPSPVMPALQSTDQLREMAADDMVGSSSRRNDGSYMLQAATGGR